jgi:hypothetical protein
VNEESVFKWNEIVVEGQIVEAVNALESSELMTCIDVTRSHSLSALETSFLFQPIAQESS